MKPNKQRIRAWVKALRSGKYKQTRRQLRNNDSFCCLGVGCEVYRKGAKKGRWRNDAFYTEGIRSCNVLPLIVSKYFGVAEFPKCAGVSLDVLNDNLGKDFPYIADAIEKEYLK